MAIAKYDILCTVAGATLIVEADSVEEAILQAIRYERSQCQELAARYGGRDAEELADLIGQRSFRKHSARSAAEKP